MATVLWITLYDIHLYMTHIALQAWRKLENSEGATSAERIEARPVQTGFHGGEAPEIFLDFRAKIVKI